MGVEANSAEALARQNCATILLQRQANKYKAVSRGGGRSFKCKSCDRAFETFQALGGHRASHKRLRIESGGGGLVKKAHECRECRVGFPTGQALGGHMRKHVDLNAKRKRAADDDDDDQQTKQLNTFTKSKINLLCLNLDLNFPPPLEDMYYSGFFQGATVG